MKGEEGRATIRAEEGCGGRPSSPPPRVVSRFPSMGPGTDIYLHTYLPCPYNDLSFNGIILHSNSNIKCLLASVDSSVSSKNERLTVVVTDLSKDKADRPCPSTTTMINSACSLPLHTHTTARRTPLEMTTTTVPQRPR